MLKILSKAGLNNKKNKAAILRRYNDYTLFTSIFGLLYDSQLLTQDNFENFDKVNPDAYDFSVILKLCFQAKILTQFNFDKLIAWHKDSRQIMMGLAELEPAKMVNQENFDMMILCSSNANRVASGLVFLNRTPNLLKKMSRILLVRCQEEADKVAGIIQQLIQINLMTAENQQAIIQSFKYAYNTREALAILAKVQLANQENFDKLIKLKKRGNKFICLLQFIDNYKLELTQALFDALVICQSAEIIHKALLWIRSSSHLTRAQFQSIIETLVFSPSALATQNTLMLITQLLNSEMLNAQNLNLVFYISKFLSIEQKNFIQQLKCWKESSQASFESFAARLITREMLYPLMQQTNCNSHVILFAVKTVISSILARKLTDKEFSTLYCDQMKLFQSIKTIRAQKEVACLAESSVPEPTSPA